MVPKITKGRSAYGALGYDHGPGRRDEHENPHKVAGNVAGGSWRDRAKAIDAHAQAARPDVARPIHRTALRLSPEDRALTDKEWRQVAETYVKRMGYDGCPWEATRHADDHIHLTVSRVKWDGGLATDSHDYAKAQKVCREIESRHRLVDASKRFRRSEPQITRNEQESAQRRGVAVPEREALREKLRAAEAKAGGTREGYEAALRAQGVSYRVNIASTGRVSGYSYHLDGHRDSTGAPVHFKGSQLGKDFTWSRSQKRIGLDKEPNTLGARPISRESARQTASSTAGTRGPEHVSTERENLARTQHEKLRERLQTAGLDDEAISARLTAVQNFPHAYTGKDAQRMSGDKTDTKQSGAGLAITRAEAVAKAAEAARKRIQEQEAREIEQTQHRGKGVER